MSLTASHRSRSSSALPETGIGRKSPAAISRVETVSEVDALPDFDQPVALLAQTTLSHRDWEDVAVRVRELANLAFLDQATNVLFIGGPGVGSDDLQRELKVRYLVEGSVRRTPERVRIAVRLTDLPRGVLLWSESYDSSAASIFSVHCERYLL